MEDEQRRQIDTIIRVSKFMADQGLDKPPFAIVRKRIDAAAVHLVELAEAQYKAHKRVVQVGWEITALRQALREEHMISIARAGKKVLKDQPEIRDEFATPGKRAKSATLIASARSMAKHAKAARNKFIEQGFPPNFITQMLTATRQLKTLERESDLALRRQKTATAALAADVRDARQDVDILDALLLPRLRDDKDLAFSWRIAKKIRGRRGNPKHRRWKWSLMKGPMGV
jgi:hypothetical protein